MFNNFDLSYLSFLVVLVLLKQNENKNVIRYTYSDRPKTWNLNTNFHTTYCAKEHVTGVWP